MAILGNKISEVSDSELEFEMDVLEGLLKSPKTLPSKYFYDKKGDALFVQIMNMPEYYLTDCEMEIFQRQSGAIAKAMDMPINGFDLIELGAGDGSKTVHLLQTLLTTHQFSYRPVDISSNALNQLSDALQDQLPELTVDGLIGDYFQVLEELKSSTRPKVFLFLGSNIGNLEDEQAAALIHKIASTMKEGDKILMGVDLKKDPSIILPAYNDAAGITRAFNLNLLERINRELGADFDSSKFEHTPEYDEGVGVAKSYLTSLEDQEVELTDISITFKKGEKIHTEISRKYDATTVQNIINGAQLTIRANFNDSRNYFTDFLIEKL